MSLPSIKLPSRPPGAAHINYTMAGVCSVGGIIGYTRTKSMASLIAGLTLGAAYAGSGYLISHHDPVQGFALGTAASLLLTASMGRRYAKTQKFMPAGVLTLTGIGTTVYNGQKYLQWTNVI